PVLHLPSLYNTPQPTQLYTLSLHDALPICSEAGAAGAMRNAAANIKTSGETMPNATNESTTGSAKPSIFVESRVSRHTSQAAIRDRKSTRLNSSHVAISYAVFCLKKKKKTT